MRDTRRTPRRRWTKRICAKDGSYRASVQHSVEFHPMATGISRSSHAAFDRSLHLRLESLAPRSGTVPLLCGKESLSDAHMLSCLYDYSTAIAENRRKIDFNQNVFFKNI